MYESFKSELLMMLKTTEIDQSAIDMVSICLDRVSQKYKIVKESTELSTVCSFPEAAKLFLASKAAEGKSPGSVKTYKSYLNSMFASIRKPVDQITANDIRIYLYYCREKLNYKASTIETIRRVINNMFEWCVLEEIVQKNPCKRIKPGKTEKNLRHAMKPIELEYMRRSCKNIREKAIIDFLYSTGARVSEVCNCKLSNIDWEKKTVLIEHGKGGVSRLTFLNPESEVSLKSYLTLRKDKTDYIFSASKQHANAPLTPRSIQRIIDRIANRSDNITTHVTPHVFRHTVATNALKNGMPVEQVQRFLGHANINTTMIYAQVDVEDVRLSHAKYVA